MSNTRIRNESTQDHTLQDIQNMTTIRGFSFESEITNREDNACHSCCFTGHRIIASKHAKKIEANLSALISSLAAEGVTTFICGGALGFDTLAAENVINEKSKNPDIKLILALPCRNHFKGWSAKYISNFRKIAAAADEVLYISDEYRDGCMQKRNRYMVENSLHCVFYMTSPKGGTAYTVRYALQSNLIMHNIMTV